jgi:hypothetical protein
MLFSLNYMSTQITANEYDTLFVEIIVQSQKEKKNRNRQKEKMFVLVIIKANSNNICHENEKRTFD